jgi:hypothetical protein
LQRVDGVLITITGDARHQAESDQLIVTRPGHHREVFDP